MGFTTNGYAVSIPLNDTQDYDLVIEKEEMLFMYFEKLLLKYN